MHIWTEGAPAARILDCWDVIKGEAIGTMPQTYNLLTKPTTQTHSDVKEEAAMTAVWTKKNSQAISLIQGMTSPALWPD